MIQKKRARNPRLLKIKLHTFRHWRGTVEYHETKDIVHIQNELGHKNIKNTMIYIHLEQALFQTSSDEFYSATAKDLQEACKLIETGFEYVTTFNNMMLFRKRK